MASKPATSPQQHQSSLSFDAAAVVLGCACIALLFQRHVPESYMDEIFHAPQTQKYCQGRLSEWDPKITTFPGLYLLAAPYALAVNWMQRVLLPSSPETACTTAVLRSINILFAAIFFAVFQLLYRKLQPHKSPEFAALMAVVALLLPTHFLYAFLYYTDMGAVTFILASYLASLHGRSHASAALGGLAVLFRQTNAVWLAFILGASVVRWASKGDGARFARLPAERQLLHVSRAAWLHRWRLIGEFWSLALIPAAFGGFVLWNGGVVVGDRDHHAPVLHLMQVPYLLLFVAAALAPVHFSMQRVYEASRQLRASLRTSPGKVLRLWGSLATLTSYAAQHYTLAHPFLLSDNRHYAFYIWKDFFGAHPAAKFTLVPAYLYSAWSVWRSLVGQGREPVLWALGLAAACALTLVPAWLVDFRYFTVPFMMVLMHMKPPTALQATLTAAMFAAVNLFVIYMFLFRPFTWPDGSTARFLF